MPEPVTPSTDGGQAPTSGTPQVGTSTIDGQAPVSQTQPSEHERQIAELRKENASARAKLKAFEEAQAAAELAKLGDLEKAQKRAEQAEKQIQTYKQELINAQVKLAAKDKGIIDPDIAALALHDKLEFGDDGMPNNLDKALDDLIKSKPYLLANAESPAQTAGLRTPPTTPANNPGRSSIVQPGTLPANKIMKFADMDWKK